MKRTSFASWTTRRKNTKRLEMLSLLKLKGLKQLKLVLKLNRKEERSNRRHAKTREDLPIRSMLAE